MRILNTAKKTIFVLSLTLAFGCSVGVSGEDPKEYVKNSDLYYQKAVTSYKKLIAASKNPAGLYLQLGRLYFNRGDYALAIEAFKNCAQPEAKKFLALSFYRQAEFTDALDIFSKERIDDDEYNYYYGLTCERLNLFDEALKIYRKIQGAGFSLKARFRIEEIERESGSKNIKDEDPATARIISLAPADEAYPQAGALFLLADENTQINEDNTQVSDMRYLVKILNERGKENFAEAPIEYDSTFEKIELIYARSIKPDGRVVYVGSRHLRDLSKYLNFPLYSNARVFIISFPEVAIGSVLEYKVRIKRSQLINKKDFFLSYRVQSSEPVLEAKFNLTIPKGRSLNLKFINEPYNDFGAELKPQKEEEGGKLTYRWHFKNIPQIVPEPDMPADSEINPAVLISTFNSWQDIYDWWYALAKDKMKADADIKEKVAQLTKGRDTELQKASSIYNFCAKEIRYVAIEYGQAGYEPHSAADVFKNKYGDCKDQAILLVTMLRQAGFKAYPVLIATKDYYNLNSDFPSGLFNHCIAALLTEKGMVFLDPTASTCSFSDLPGGDQGRRVLVFSDDSYAIEETPLFPAGHNLARQELTLTINPDDSISGTKKNITRGTYDQAQRYWLLYTQKELVENALKESIQGISIGAKLEKYSIDNLQDLNTPVILSYAFRGPEYFTSAGNLRIMPQLSSVDTGISSKESRRYPIDFGLPQKKESYVKVAIPRGFAVKYLPQPVEKESPWLRFSQRYSLEPGYIILNQKSEDKKLQVPPDEYRQFKEFMENLGRSVKQRVVLEKVK
jgi:hypothetical protein